MDHTSGWNVKCRVQGLCYVIACLPRLSKLQLLAAALGEFQLHSAIHGAAAAELLDRRCVERLSAAQVIVGCHSHAFAFQPAVIYWQR